MDQGRHFLQVPCVFHGWRGVAYDERGQRRPGKKHLAQFGIGNTSSEEDGHGEELQAQAAGGYTVTVSTMSLDQHTLDHMAGDGVASHDDEGVPPHVHTHDGDGVVFPGSVDEIMTFGGTGLSVEDLHDFAIEYGEELNYEPGD